MSTTNILDMNNRIDALEKAVSGGDSAVPRTATGTTLATLNAALLALSDEQAARATVVVNDSYWLHKALDTDICRYNTFILDQTKMLEFELRTSSHDRTPIFYELGVTYGSTVRSNTEVTVTKWTIYYQGTPIS